MDALRALNGFGLGARPGETGAIGNGRSWLHAQLQGDPTPVREPVPASVAAEVLQALRRAGQLDERERQHARQRAVQVAAQEAQAAWETRVTSTAPFVERLVMFWSNHLCVSARAKQPVALLAGRYEREAIRPHVLGRFEDMVLASARHPAMLIYLDNAVSIGPGSPAARRRAQGRGLNENYARELLELHTLGVDGGYTQEDVQQLARLLTGWTVSPAMGFRFEPALHEPGTKTVLGERFGVGAQEGERAIRALCRHPSTALHVARRMVQHFIADDAPPAAVQRVAAVWESTGGDLRAVSRSLVDLDEAAVAEARKFRSPQDWLIAVARALPGSVPAGAAPTMLRSLRQPLWGPDSPKGYGDGMQDWADPDALLNRAELARSLARRAAQGMRGSRDGVPGIGTLLDTVRADPALRQMVTAPDVQPHDAVALLFASPAFQWR